MKLFDVKREWLEAQGYHWWEVDDILNGRYDPRTCCICSREWRPDDPDCAVVLTHPITGQFAVSPHHLFIICAYHPEMDGIRDRLTGMNLKVHKPLTKIQSLIKDALYWSKASIRFAAASIGALWYAFTYTIRQMIKCLLVDK